MGDIQTNLYSEENLSKNVWHAKQQASGASSKIQENSATLLKQWILTQEDNLAGNVSMLPAVLCFIVSDIYKIALKNRKNSQPSLAS